MWERKGGSSGIGVAALQLAELVAWSGVDSVNGGWVPTANTALPINLGGAGVPTAFGTAPVARVPDNSSFLSRLVRCGVVTSAVAGNVSAFRAGGAASFIGAMGWRQRWVFGVSAIAASQRYFVGSQSVNPSNVAPSTLLDMMGVGAEAAGNLRLYRNDSAGAATMVDLGASFPAFTLGATYMAEFWVLRGGASGRYRVRRLDVPADTGVVEVAGDLPTPSTPIGCGYIWTSNNVTPAACSLEFVELRTAVPVAL